MEIDGARHQAVWVPRGDDAIEVRSDFGSRVAPLNGAAPGDAARSVLERLVRSSSSSHGTR